jgi:hypothetical protein
MRRTFAAKTFRYDGELAAWLNALEREFIDLTVHGMTAVLGTSGHISCTVTVSFIEEARP